jgi:hypothetical protein
MKKDTDLVMPKFISLLVYGKSIYNCRFCKLYQYGMERRKAGGNYESAVLYQNLKGTHTLLLEPSTTKNLTFLDIEQKKRPDSREDVYVDFVLDWYNKTLDYDEAKQRGTVDLIIYPPYQ